MELPTPNPTDYPKTYEHFGFYADSSPNALDLWFRVILSLLAAAEHVTAKDSAEITTLEQVDALSLSLKEWSDQVPDAGKASDLMKAKFLLGFAGLYQTSSMNRWLDMVGPMFRAGSLLMMESKGGKLLREVMQEAGKRR